MVMVIVIVVLQVAPADQRVYVHVLGQGEAADPDLGDSKDTG